MCLMKRLQSILVLLLTICLMSFVLVSCPNTNHPNDGTENYGSEGKSVNTTKTTFIASQPNNPSSFTKLVWSDEFEGTTIKEANWTFETGANGWGNNELENYTNGANASVGNGVLTITAKSDLTSTRIKTHEKKSFRYGKIVARIKMDQGTGSWPAFWMLGDNITTAGWPYCGKIDIMEHANNDSFIYNTCHWNDLSSDPNSNYKNANYGGKTNENLCNIISNLDVTDWHEYSIVWTETKIDFFVDDIKTMAIAIGKDGLDAFNKNFFILLNFAMGGNFTGIHNKAQFTNLPWNMYVDYIRVYQSSKSDASGYIESDWVDDSLIEDDDIESEE